VAIEVHEFLQGEWVSDEVGGGVPQTLLVLGLDRLAHVCGEAGVSPGEELVDELLGDGVAIEELGEESLAQ
jgi:hypothetical protein